MHDFDSIAVATDSHDAVAADVRNAQATREKYGSNKCAICSKNVPLAKVRAGLLRSGGPEAPGVIGHQLGEEGHRWAQRSGCQLLQD
jgi:hypothetical protein